MNPDKWCCALACDEGRKIFRTTDAKTKERLEISFCLSCGLVQQTEIPTSFGLRQYYSHHYREDYKRSLTPKNKHIFRAARAARDRLDFLSLCFSSMRLPLPRTLIDIGAGGGEVVYAARRLGMDASGVEPNQGYSEFARNAYGVSVETKHLDQVFEKRAEIVTLFHVLEHMPSPCEVMAMLFQIVEHNGWLYIEVPNIEQPDAAPSNIFFKAHLFYFSVATLTSVASSYFEPIFVDSTGNLRVLFKRREVPVALKKPTSQQVQQTLDRLAKKGWIEYLFKGGGLLKPVRRISQYWYESRLKGLTPREIVERAFVTLDSAGS